MWHARAPNPGPACHSPDVTVPFWGALTPFSFFFLGGGAALTPIGVTENRFAYLAADPKR